MLLDTVGANGIRPSSLRANTIRPYKPENQIVPNNIENCCIIWIFVANKFTFC
jgi:hypothetical protein